MRIPLLSLAQALTISLTLVGAVCAEQKPEFKLGFKALAEQIPEIVGEPLENERWGANGDSLQQTSKGLMVWRKADNWTAFTDGSRSWINGPEGLKSRGNDERFAWEAGAPGSTPTSTQASGAAPQGSAAQPQSSGSQEARQVVLDWLARNPQFAGWVWPDGSLRRQPPDWEGAAQWVRQQERTIQQQEYQKQLQQQELQRQLNEQRQLEEIRQQQIRQQQEQQRQQQQQIQRPQPYQQPYQPPVVPVNPYGPGRR